MSVSRKTTPSAFSMRKIKTAIISVLMLCLATAGIAQHHDNDTLQSRYRTTATTFGIGRQSTLDTYLTPLEYKGPELSIARETMRKTRFNRNITVQNFFRINAAYLDKSGYKMYSGLANWNYGLHYNFNPVPNLKILAGGLADMNGGVVYNPRNSNNPASAKAFIDIDLSAMAIYKLKLKKYNMTFRYQINLPVAGIMFAPEYGASYYEMFYLGHTDGIASFTSFHNHYSMRQMITVDFPCRYVLLRAGYYWEMEQSHIKNIKAHTYSHSFMIGFVRNIKLIRDRQGRHLPERINPF